MLRDPLPKALRGMGVASGWMPGSTADLLSCSVLINVLSLAMPLALLQVYDRIIPNTATSTLALLMTGVITALVLEVLLRMGRDYLNGWKGAQMEHGLSCAAVQHLLRAELEELEHDGAGVHLNRLQALSALREFYAGQAIVILCDLPFSILFLCAVGYLAGTLVLVPIAIMIVFVVAALIVGNRLRASLAERMNADDRRLNFIVEVLQGVHTVKSLAVENLMLRRYERLQESAAAHQHDVAQHSASALGVGVLFSQLTLFGVVGLGAIIAMNGGLTVGGLAACTLLSSRAMQPLQRAVGIWTRFQKVRLARARIAKIFALQQENRNAGAAPAKLTGAIELRDVSFRYPGAEQDVIAGATISIEPGETIAVLGGNASGTTTLLFLMMGLLRPRAGTVLIDGFDMASIEPALVRGQIAYLPQHVTLFDGTIADNITMFRPELAARVREVAERVGLDDPVAHMPLGYGTRIGYGADDQLPRGIRQQIGFARALINDPVMLLFDKANMGLDRRHDELLRRLLEKLKGEIVQVLVTHRPSFVALADRVFELNNGVLSPREQQPAAKFALRAGA
ncbi:MAG: ATP-binding cassette domain-containing protein [Rhodospirillales bacterium]|nr:ATP-binding cassette domain-containing protein [Rhodospirillales bacterium]